MDDDFFTTHPAVAKRKVDDPSLDSLNQRGDKRRRLNYLPNGSLFEIITMPTATAVKVALGKISPEVTNTVAGNSKQDLHVAGNASRSDKAIDDVILKASTSGFVKGHYSKCLRRCLNNNYSFNLANDSLPSIKRLPRPILRPKAAKGKKPSKLSTKADVARVSSGEMGTKETSTETNGGVNETQKAFKPEADGVSRNSGGDEDPDATLVDPAYDETFLPVAHAIIKRKRDRKEHNDEASVRCSKKAKHFDVEEVSMKQRIKELKEWKADNINTIRDNNELLAEMTMDLVGRLMASEHRYASLEKKISRLEDELSLVGSQNFISSDGRTRIILSSKPANSTRTQHDSQESSSTPQSPTTTSSKVKGYDLIKDNPSFIPGLANPKHTPAPEWLMGEGTELLPGRQERS